MKQLLFRPPLWTHYPLPLPGPLGPPWELPWTTLILHIRRYLNTTELNCSTSGSEEDVTLKFAWFWPLGALYLGPHGATCTIWTTLNPWPHRMIPDKFGLKSDQAFSRSRWNSYFLHRAPSPTCYPPQGPIGANLGTAMNNLYSSPI